MNTNSLDSLEVRGFRAFRDLRIEKLGRVNLIVGRNSVGKTCLLEALYLYARRGAPAAVEQLLRSRDEKPNVVFKDDYDTEQLVNDFRHLFYGRQDLTRTLASAQIGPLDRKDATLSLQVGWLKEGSSEQNGNGRVSSTENKELVLGVNFANTALASFDFSSFETRATRRGLIPGMPEETCCFVPMAGLENSVLAELWSSTALTANEEEVLDGLRIIAPNLERLAVLQRGRVPRNSSVVVRVADQPEPIPLKSLGEGMNRLFGLTLSLVNARGGFLLVDEIESGLYYETQPAMWRLLFTVAKKLNVQVFATTHSYDCIRAFQSVAVEHEEEGALVRLYRSADGDTRATLFNEDDLQVANEQGVELR